MKAQLIGKNQIRAFISPEEVKERAIDLETATYHDPNVTALINDVLLTLKDQVEESIFKMPHRTEVIPLSDGSLILLITWSLEEREYLSEKNTTFTPPPAIPGDPNAPGFPPYALPIDELQASVVADIISALSTGDLKEHLKKYLNEDFLDELLRAVSASGLEDMISSFFSEDGEDAGAAVSEIFGGENEANAPKALAKTAKKTIKKAPAECICINFKSIADIEKALEAADFSGYKGESALYKSGKDYILILTPGKMSVKNFDEEADTLLTLYSGERRPAAYSAYLSEHAKTIINKNAVAALLG